MPSHPSHSASPRAWVHRATAALCLAAVVLTAGCSSTAQPTAQPAAHPTTTRPATSAPPTTVPARKSTGCGVAPDAPRVTDNKLADAEQQMVVGDVARTYRLGVPVKYDQNVPAPLVLNLHGAGSSGTQASIYGGFTVAATGRGIITVAPSAINGKWQLAGHGADNDFLTELIDDLKSRYCVDLNRVFAIGMSLGAWKAAVTACGAPETFAAAVLVTVEVHPPSCKPLPVVAFHGTADAAVPYGEGSGYEFPNSPNANLPGTRTNIANWADGNNCDPAPKKTTIGDDVEKWTYTNCAADVVLYTIIGGGHTWPGSDIKIGATTQTIDATQIALDWFAAHPRRP